MLVENFKKWACLFSSCVWGDLKSHVLIQESGNKIREIQGRGVARNREPMVASEKFFVNSFCLYNMLYKANLNLSS